MSPIHKSVHAASLPVLALFNITASTTTTTVRTRRKRRERAKRIPRAITTELSIGRCLVCGSTKWYKVEVLVKGFGTVGL